MDKARPQAASLVADLLAFIAMDGCTDEQFDALALRLFAYQYESNAPFRSFCQRRGATLRNVKTWSDIPAVPIDAFKAMELRSEPASPAACRASNAQAVCDAVDSPRAAHAGSS